jgi:hypothetical protein
MQLFYMNWKTTISFMLFATSLTVFVGWLISTSVLPIQKTIHFNEAERSFMSVWIKLAIALGLILFTIAWLVWIKDLQTRKILGLYLSVLIIQIVTEQVSSRIKFPGLGFDERLTLAPRTILE